MRKLTYSLLAALLLVAAAVVLHKTKTGNQELFQANVEALQGMSFVQVNKKIAKQGVNDASILIIQGIIISKMNQTSDNQSFPPLLDHADETVSYLSFPDSLLHMYKP